MTILGCKNIIVFSIIFLLLVILISNTVDKEVYTEAVTALTTATQISNSDLEIPSNTTVITNTSITNLEVQNQNISTTTVILSTTVTVTSILIHTTTLTFMMTISKGVSENQVVTFIMVIGTIAIIAGYLTGYSNAMSKQREAVSKVQKRGRT